MLTFHTIQELKDVVDDQVVSDEVVLVVSVVSPQKNSASKSKFLYHFGCRLVDKTKKKSHTYSHPNTKSTHTYPPHTHRKDSQMFRLITRSSIVAQRPSVARATTTTFTRSFSQSSALKQQQHPFFFAQSHEWAQQSTGDLFNVGISDAAQNKLGEVIHLELHVSEGQSVQKGDMIAEVESVKAVSEIYAPISGTVEKLNPQFASEGNFSLLNTSPEVEGWIAQIKASDAAQETAELMTQDKYQKFCEEEEH